MPNTPDRFPGTREEEEVLLEETTEDPTASGAMRFVSGAFRFKDDTGFYDPRSGGALPPATEVGQILFSCDGLTFAPEKPLVSDSGLLLTNDEGAIVVKG